MEEMNTERVYLIYSVLHYSIAKKKVLPSELFELKDEFLNQGLDPEDAEHPMDYEELVECLKVEEADLYIEILEYLVSYSTYEGFILPQRLLHYFDLLRETGSIPFDFWETTYVLTNDNLGPKYLDLPA